MDFSKIPMVSNSGTFLTSTYTDSIPSSVLVKSLISTIYASKTDPPFDFQASKPPLRYPKIFSYPILNSLVIVSSSFPGDETTINFYVGFINNPT